VVRGERRRREERRGTNHYLEAEASGVKMRRDDDGVLLLCPSPPFSVEKWRNSGDPRVGRKIILLHFELFLNPIGNRIQNSCPKSKQFIINLYVYI